jgi:hypothetical protein
MLDRHGCQIRNKSHFDCRDAIIGPSPDWARPLTEPTLCTVPRCSSRLPFPLLVRAGLHLPPVQRPPPRPARSNLSGTVTDRISGVPIDGSTITVTGVQAVTTSVTNGHYSIDGLMPGNPTVSITGPSHVDHQTYDVQMSGTTATKDFTVLRWGSGRFGAVYDAGFHAFFNLIARSPDRTPPVVIKWAQLPQEIYVVNEGISPDALADVLVLLGEVNQESLSDMFGGTAQPVPITTGPMPTQRWVPGRILVQFAPGKESFGQMGCGAAGNVMNCGLLQMSLTGFDPITPDWPRKQRKYYILHEMLHVAGGNHAYTGGVGAAYAVQNNSVMSTGNASLGVPQTLAPVDKLAMWLMYHSDTKPGNTYPDTNPH